MATTLRPSFFVRAATLGAFVFCSACSGSSSTPGGPGGAPGTGGAPDTDGGAGTGGSTSGGSTDCWDGPLVSLTYDDALPTHLSIAAPALDAHGLRGTFFVTNVSGSAPSWRQLREGGHELGAHTFNHPCPASNSWVPAGNANEDYDLARMAAELDEQIAQLASVGQNAPLPFAYPCGVTWVGEAHDSYIGLIEERFSAARGVAPGVVTQPNALYNVPSSFLTGSGSSLTSVAEGAKRQNGWVVFGFHGVGGDHSAVTAEAHEELLGFLEAEVNAGNLRVLPFGAAAECMSAR